MLQGLYESMAWVLAFFYQAVHSYGFAIILLTLAVMAVVTPLTLKGTRSMMAMQAYQPEIRRIQQEFKGDRQQLNEELLKFYRENSINPIGSCLPLLVQMPVFFVLFHVVRGITNVGDNGFFDPQNLDVGTELYRSLSEQKEMLFLRFDLADSAVDALRDRGFLPAIPFLILVGINIATSYIQQKQVSGRNPGSMTPQQKMLMRVVPIFSLTMGWFPAALGVYWATSNLCRVVTQYYISRKFYGMRRGQLPEGASAVVDAPSSPATGTPPKAKAKDAGTAGGNGAAKGGNAGSKRPQSGRVTGSKSRNNGGSPNRTPRPAPGRRGGDASGPAGSRNEQRRRRTPPTANGGGSAGGGGDNSGDSRKKRRK